MFWKKKTSVSAPIVCMCDHFEKVRWWKWANGALSVTRAALWSAAPARFPLHPDGLALSRSLHWRHRVLRLSGAFYWRGGGGGSSSREVVGQGEPGAGAALLSKVKKPQRWSFLPAHSCIPNSSVCGSPGIRGLPAHAGVFGVFFLKHSCPFLNALRISFSSRREQGCS